jgi:hypothetical protein
MAPFPFTADGFVIHRGRGSLAAMVASDDRSHPMFDWAADDHEPHFGGIGGAADRSGTLRAQFNAAIGAPLRPRAPSYLIGATHRRNPGAGRPVERDPEGAPPTPESPSPKAGRRHLGSGSDEAATLRSCRSGVIKA